MDASTINWLAVIVATLSAFVLGALWYSPALFGKVWMAAAGLSEEQVQQGNMGKIFGVAFILELVMAVNLAFFLNDPSTTAGYGAAAGFAAGFGWVLMGIGVVSMFEQRSWKYILVNGGYMTVSLTLMGMILGAWR